MHKTFSFKLYRSQKNRHLHRQIEIAASIWNHCIALHKRYYRLYHKTLNKYRLQKHLTKLKHRPRFRYWNELGSQAVQDITDRIDRAYTLFFRNRKAGIKPAPPGFRPSRKYQSFMLKQAGWALPGENRVRIGRQIFRFSKSREIEGTVKTVTLKRDFLGDLYVFFCCEVESQASKAGSVVHHVDRWLPSSKLCSACGTVNEALNLKDRQWRCVCGAVHDRDHNAALNIFREGASSPQVRRHKAPRGGRRLNPESSSFKEGSTSSAILESCAQLWRTQKPA